MKTFKKLLLLIFFLVLSINQLKALEKVSYIDIDYILANTLAGKSLLSKLKKEEESKINKFKSSEDDFRNKENKILAKKNLISKEEISKELKLLQIKFQEYRKVDIGSERTCGAWYSIDVSWK